MAQGNLCSQILSHACFAASLVGACYFCIACAGWCHLAYLLGPGKFLASGLVWKSISAFLLFATFVFSTVSLFIQLCRAKPISKIGIYSGILSFMLTAALLIAELAIGEWDVQVSVRDTCRTEYAAPVLINWWWIRE